jgi:serine/threonine protein kinase
MLNEGDLENDCFGNKFIFYNSVMNFLDTISRCFSHGSGGNVYLSIQNSTKKRFILKVSAIISTLNISLDEDTSESIGERKKEILEKKQKFEKLILQRKAAMEKSENVVIYVDHWYSKDDKYSYVVMEYCSGGDLAQEIKKKIKENKKFTEQVYYYYYYL